MLGGAESQKSWKFIFKLPKIFNICDELILRFWVVSLRNSGKCQMYLKVISRMIDKNQEAK